MSAQRRSWFTATFFAASLLGAYSCGGSVDLKFVGAEDSGSDAGGAGGDIGVDGSANDPCRALDCGAHGECVVSGGQASCQCEPEYDGNRCTVCASGFQDEDEDGSCQADCSGRDCSDRGECSDETGEALCTCEGLFSGDDCEACLPGFDLNGDACEWVGGLIQNGSFEDESAWEYRGGAEHSAAGELGRLAEDALCFGGSISQPISLPPYDLSPQLVLKFRAWRSGSDFAGEMAVQMGGQVSPVTIASTPPAQPNNSICLGPAALGGDTQLTFLPGEFPVSCNFDDLQVDDVDIVEDEAGDCARNTQLGNPSFDDMFTWEAGSAGVSVGGGYASFSVGNQCSAGSLTLSQPVMVPQDTALGGAAIEVDFMTGTGSGGSICSSDPCRDQLYLELIDAGGNVTEVAAFMSTSSRVTRSVCVPPEWRGVPGTFQLRVGRPGCASAYGFNTTVYSAEIIESEGCRLVDGVSNGGFEASGPLEAAWPHAASNDPRQPNLFTLGSEPLEAAVGTGYAVMSVLDGVCGGVTATTRIITPGPGLGGAAALSFQYRYTSPAGGTFEVCADSVGCAPLPAAQGDWEPFVYCLDPNRFGPGLPNRIQFTGSSAGDCSALLQIDELKLGTSELCE